MRLSGAAQYVAFSRAGCQHTFRVLGCASLCGGHGFPGLRFRFFAGLLQEQLTGVFGILDELFCRSLCRQLFFLGFRFRLAYLLNGFN